MRLLFTLDLMDHGACTHTYVRNSARAVIIREGRIAMVRSLTYDYYKFPGGGIEPGESPESALIREVREEAGLSVIPASIREYGAVHRIQKSTGDETERFMQDNYYYLCAVEDAAGRQSLDDYEAEARFLPVWVDPETAVRTNREKDHGDADGIMLEREVRVLELLLAEGYFKA